MYKFGLMSPGKIQFASALWCSITELENFPDSLGCLQILTSLKLSAFPNYSCILTITNHCPK